MLKLIMSVKHFPLCLTFFALAIGVAMAQEAGSIQHPEAEAQADAKTFSWPELNRVYQAAMVEYNEKRREKEYTSSSDITFKLEKAGIAQAIEAPVKDISARQAAAILNDYGFLSKGHLTEQALRRAIELDPKRRIAYLNLADWIGERMPNGASSWDEIVAQWQKAEKFYRQYLALGGKETPQIREFLRGDLAAAQPSDACQAIALYANAGRLNEILFTQVSKEISIRGGKYDFVFTTQGTARVPYIDITDAKTGKKSEEQWVKELEQLTAGQYWGGDNLGLIIYHDAAYILHYRDYRHPVKAFSLADKANCAFNNETVEKIGPEAADPEMCRKLAAGAEVTPVVFKEKTVQFDIEKYYGETALGGVAYIDIKNDKESVKIASLSLTSGAGAGCDEIFYDILNTENTDFQPGETHDLLMKIQNADEKNRYPIVPCENDPRWFSYDGKIYFESKPKTWPPIDKRNQYHYVKKIENNKIVDICDYRFETKTNCAVSLEKPEVSNTRSN